MGHAIDVGDRLASGQHDLEFIADVVVIGGSLAGSWAAIAAAQSEAKVILVEKGYVGASGPIAAGSTGAYFIKPDDPLQREVTVRARLPLAFGLADARWAERIYDQSFRNLQQMADWGYKYPRNAEGKEMRGGTNPNVLAFLRKKLLDLGVTLLDHSPALELLVSDGVVGGIAGVNRKTGQTYAIRTGAVVIATGGTAFLSGAAGTGGNTGDGYLLGAEAGAEFSGMEFNGQFHYQAHGAASSKGGLRDRYGTLRDDKGNVVTLGRGTVQAILDTGKAWDVMDKITDPEVQELILKSPTPEVLFYRDSGINPFKDRFQVDFVCEGSIRAGGGLAINDDLQTTAPGLFAAGDVTSREKVAGAGPTGGGPASGWALGAGALAGKSAARFAKRQGNAIRSRSLRSVGGAGLRPTSGQRADISVKQVIAEVQEEMLALDRNYWRTGPKLEASLAKFARLWKDVREGLAAEDAGEDRASARAVLRAREAASLLAAARLMNTSALERKESRGLHRRNDFPKLDPDQTHHLISGGVDEIWVKRQAPDPTADLRELA
jgi:succinate dehydrogenase/fumarate reductase flavoprotein subunit